MKTALKFLALLLAITAVEGCALKPEEISRMDCSQIAVKIAEAQGQLRHI